jgi:hypothetical protein
MERVRGRKSVVEILTRDGELDSFAAIREAWVFA